MPITYGFKYASVVNIRLYAGNYNSSPKLLKVHLSDNIAMLKMILESHNNLPWTATELAASEYKDNRSDYSTLAEASISDFAEVRASFTVKRGWEASGSLFGFMDVFIDDAIKEGRWSPAARWRVCCRGLASERVSTNKTCLARNELARVKHKFGSFDIFSLESSFPLCPSSTSIENMLFSSCFYLIQGKTMDLKAVKKYNME